MTNFKLLATTLLTTAATTTFAAQKPNIIFILADDLGSGDIASYNEECKIKTPNVDKLVEDGVKFTDAHTSSAVSTPTRYGVITGRYNWRSTLKKGVLQGYSKALIPESRTTIADKLKEVGYTTACIGKWHLGWDWNNIEKGDKAVDFSKKITNGPTERGFDYFFGFCGSLDMAPYVWVENDMPTAVPTEYTVDTGKQSHWRKGLTSDDFNHERALSDITERSADYIKKASKDEAPFYLYMPIPSPHTPILPSDQFKGKSGLNDYGDYVMRVDHCVGLISKAIEESGEADNTIIVFTADNGCSNQADYKELLAKGHNPSYIYRGMKTSLYEGGHRVPCIVKYPAKFKPHTVKQTICLTDFFRTFATIAGAKVNDNEAEDSYNITPLLAKTKEGKLIREATISHSSMGEFAIRKGDWKLLYFFEKDLKFDRKAPEPKLGYVELYNIKEDPSETNNLVEKYPELVEEMRLLMVKYVEEGRSTKGAPQKNEGDYVGMYFGVDESKL